MKRLLLSVLAMCAALTLRAQMVTPEAGVQFQGLFVNDEFDASDQRLMASGTLGAARVFPYAGVRFGQHHGLYAGVDVIQDFGVFPQKPSAELAFWYEFSKEHFNLFAGLVPYAKLVGNYSSAIWSDASSFYDGIFEGFMLQGVYERSYWEVMLDWCGKYGENSREQFAFYSAGDIWFNSWLALSWEGSFHHYACSEVQKGVVGDHIFHPYLKFDFTGFTGLDKFELQTGAMVGYHRDRLFNRKSVPVGADLVLELQKWGFGIRNEAYYGGSQCPFYQLTDDIGEVYADNLYSRSSIWQITPDTAPGFYDRVDVYWEKDLCEQVTLGVRPVLHFTGDGYQGWQLLLSASVNLDKITFKRKK